MSDFQFAIVIVLGLIGFVSVCVTILHIGVSLIEREIDDFRFRQELREAIQADAEYQADPSLKAHSARQHPRSQAPWPPRRV
jgi:hypothetical protein